MQSSVELRSVTRATVLAKEVFSSPHSAVVVVDAAAEETAVAGEVVASQPSRFRCQS